MATVRGGNQKRPVWFWIAIAYLIATVAYNSWSWWSPFFFDYPLRQQIGITANLGLKAIAIGLLIFRRPEGIYLLAAAFLIGLTTTLWDYYQDGVWTYLSLVGKIGRVNGFLISFAVIFYMSVLWRRGVLTGRSPTQTADLFS